jgi:hypothetical protein
VLQLTELIQIFWRVYGGLQRKEFLTNGLERLLWATGDGLNSKRSSLVTGPTGDGMYSKGSVGVTGVKGEGIDSKRSGGVTGGYMWRNL